MRNRSKTTIFLIEQLIAVAVFAACAAVCVSIFAESYKTSSAAKDLNHALIVAKNGAERHKAGEIIGEEFYDENWDACEEGTAAYVLQLESGRLTVEKMTGGEIISFAVSGGGGA